MSDPHHHVAVDTGPNPSPLDADGDGWNEDEDCNDADPRAYPGNAEVCDDGIDNDCNGYHDEWDQACFPDSSCATTPGSSIGLWGTILMAAIIVRHRAKL